MDWRFWAKVWTALQKVLAFYIFVVTHYGIEYAFTTFIMGFVPNMPFWRNLYHVITFGAFSLVYLHLLWEFATVFLPWLGGRVKLEGE